MLIPLAACSKKDNQELVETNQVEVEEKVPEKDSINLKASSFLSKLIAYNMEEGVLDIKLSNDSNYTDIENGDFDIAVVPGYLGPYFYNTTNQDTMLAAISSTDDIKLVSDQLISNQNDLKGKNLYIADPVGNLSKAIDKKIKPVNIFLKINAEYYTSMRAVTDKVENGSNFITIMTDPYYGKILDKGYYISDLASLLPIAKGEFVSEIVIVNKKYLENNKEEFETFLESYKKATKKISENPSIPDELLDYYGISEDQAKAALERQNPTFIEADTMRGTYQVFLDRLNSIDKSLLGEIKPGDDFYYINN